MKTWANLARLQVWFSTDAITEKVFGMINRDDVYLENGRIKADNFDGWNAIWKVVDTLEGDAK